MNHPAVSPQKNVLFDLVNWIHETRTHAPLLENEADGLLASLLPLQRRQHHITALAQQPLTLGLYGHSTAGKHHLLSTLLANHTGRIDIKLGEKTLDYLTQINPGHCAATLAVRFTFKTLPTIKNYPLLLTLFNESDLTQRLIRNYHAQPEAQVTESSAIARHIARLQSKRHAQIVPGISSQQVSDIARCYHAQLRRQHHLDDELWQQMADLLPWLASADRVSLLATLWGNDTGLTAQWQHLSDTLHQIGETTQLLAPASLLVDTFLHPADGFLLPTTPEDPTLLIDVMVCPLFNDESGPPVGLALQDLQALCAEVCLTLSNIPALSEVDIIDIPLTQLDYYINRLEPDTLLVCNAAIERRDVTSAGKTLTHWVDHTQGDQATLPGLIWTITPFDARTTNAVNMDGSVQHLIGQAGKRWGTLQTQEHRNIHRLLEWLTDAINNEHRAQRVAAMQSALEAQTARMFRRFSVAHSIPPETTRRQLESLIRALQSKATLHGELLVRLVPERHALQQSWQHHHQLLTKKLAGFQLDIDLFADGKDLHNANPVSYAFKVHQLWIIHLRRLAQRPEARSLFGLENTQLHTLCDLLIITSYRLDLPNLLEKSLQSGNGSMTQETNCVSNVLGDFVNWLGYSSVSPSCRPASRINKGAKVFTPLLQAQVTERLTKLSETPVHSNVSHFYDWLVALHTRAIENIGYRHPQDVADLHREKLQSLLIKLSNF